MKNERKMKHTRETSLRIKKLRFEESNNFKGSFQYISLANI